MTNADRAKSLAELVTEWVESGITNKLNWRSGLASVIERRLDRLDRLAIERSAASLQGKGPSSSHSTDDTSSSGT